MQAGARPPTDADLRQVLTSKFREAILRWALLEMKGRVRDYFDAALLGQIALVLDRLEKEPTAPIDGLLANVPLVIPRPLPRTIHAIRPGVARELAAEYQRVLNKVGEIKAATRRMRNPAAKKLVYQEELPPTTPHDAQRYLSMKASEIAYDYVARKFKLGSGPALKRRLQRMRELGGRLQAQFARDQHALMHEILPAFSTPPTGPEAR